MPLAAPLLPFLVLGEDRVNIHASRQPSQLLHGQHHVPAGRVLRQVQRTIGVSCGRGHCINPGAMPPFIAAACIA